MILTVIHIITLAVFVYFLVSTIYLLWLAFAGTFFSVPTVITSPVKRRAIILIPAYKEDSIIVETVRSACAHNYSGGEVKIIVIGDSLKQQTIAELSTFPVELLLVSFEKSSKARSLHASLPHLDVSPNSFVFILDADNIMGKDCLNKVNDVLHAGFSAVQVHRTAKNKDTPVALLDAISEEINLNIFRRGSFKRGLSAAPMGSGMAFQTSVFSEIFSDPAILESVAEDRQIENYLLRHRMRMAFIDDAYVYDEKVASVKVFKKQRIRWMEAQIGQVRHYFTSSAKEDLGARQYYHILIQILLLPRVFYLMLSCILLGIIALQVYTGVRILFPPVWNWLILIFAYWSMLLMSVPKQFFGVKTVKALFHLPRIMFTMLSALFQLKKHRQEFLHTAKSYSAKENNL